jgi:ribonuclease P protein component
MHQRLTFSKKERLCSKKLTEKLFKKSHSFFDFPFKIVYYFVDSTEILPADVPVQVLFTASKRVLKNAVSRNQAKRMMREAYRKNKMPLCEKLAESNKRLILGFIYNGPRDPEYGKTELKIISVINRLIQEVNREDKKSIKPSVNHQENIIKNSNKL